jgi:hypothetical protein
MARERGLINGNVRTTKREVRDALWELPDGDIHWQKLQGLVYGPRMGDATLIQGVKEFFQLCKQHEVPAYIISHKTKYAPYDGTKTNLREASLVWIRSNGLLEKKITGLTQSAVCFEPSRRRKIQRIARLGCTHFIDDLEETFLEDYFPRNVEKILFSPNREDHSPTGATVLDSWEEIKGYFFGADS